MTYALNPILPSKFDRFAPVEYNELKDSSYVFCEPFSMNGYIASSPFCAPRSMQPCGQLVHPEGSTFCHFRNIVSTQLVTDTHISLVEEVLHDCEAHITHADITIFLDLKKNQADYYIAVHRSKSVVWARGKLPEFFNSATGVQLELEYWLHVENFPGPWFTTAQDMGLLKNVLSSYAADVATSDGSTSPMSARQLEAHIRILDSFSLEPDIHQTYATGS